MLEAESQSLDTYFISHKGPYSTPDLIERKSCFPIAFAHFYQRTLALTGGKLVGSLPSIRLLPLDSTFYGLLSP